MDEKNNIRDQIFIKESDTQETIINMSALKEYYEDFVSKQVLDFLHEYCDKEELDMSDVTLAHVKEVLSLKSDKGVSEFDRLLNILLKDAEQKAHEEEKKASERPTKYSQPVTKLTENLPQLDFTGDTTEQEFIVSPKKSKKISLVTLVTDNTSLSDRSVTAFDNTVFNAVISFIEAGEQFFTLDQITNFIYYGDNTANRASAKQRKEVRESIRKQMFFPIDIDYTEHLALNGTPLKELNGKGRLTDQRLPLKELETENGRGNKVICYCLKDNDLPPEYVYARDVKQIATVDARLLDTPQDLHLTADDVVWRDYFIREIDTMKKNKKYSRTMKIDTILQKCNISFTTTDTRRERTRLLKRFEVLLKDFVLKKHIKGYQVERGKKRVIDGYKIEL